MTEAPQTKTLAAAWALIGALVAVLWYSATALAVGQPAEVTVTVAVVDDTGSPVAASIALDGDTRRTGSDGVTTIAVDQPILGFVRASGFIDEPVVVSPNDDRVAVSLIPATGPGGARRVLHFGGDAMLGRRYVDGDAGGGVDSPADAVGVVSDLAPLFAAADLSTLNLETVVGDDLGAPYPGKRFLLATPTDGLAALDALGVDVVTLGNNHAYDWREPGLATTLEALTGFAVAGAGPTPQAAREPAIVDLGGLTVATLSYTSVTGDVVNDALPVTGDPVPDDLAAGDAWQYETRTVRAEGWPQAPMRVGDAWRLFEVLEAELPADESARLWGALAGDDAFPELQDWVARRGHGGAAHYRAAAAAEDIAAARAAGADIVVAHLHGGLQYAPIVSEFTVRATRQMAAAGADLVIGHHPHVLQGFDWHGDVPIAHSLGNLVFDQDFTATFPSAVLRVVVDGDGVVAVRAYPVELQGHRPVPVAGRSAEDIGAQLSARSTAGHASVKAPDGTPTVVTSDAWDGAVLTSAGWGWDVAPGTSAGEGSCSLLLNGSFEDDGADGTRRGNAHWRVSDGVTTVDDSDAFDGGRVLRFADIDSGWARPVGRAALPPVRISGQTEDRSVQLRFWARGDGELTVQFDAYRFIDSDPTRDPYSEQLDASESTVLVSSETWQPFTVGVPSAQLAAGNAVMPYLRYEGDRGSSIDVDLVQLVETRAGPTGCFR